MALFVTLPFDHGTMDQSFFGKMKRITPGTAGHHPHIQRGCFRRSKFDHPLAKIFGDMKRNQMKANKDYFEVEVTAKGYQPDEINVEMIPKERVVKISGKHQEKNDEGIVTGVKRFCRFFTVPENCNIDEIKSKFSEEGVLKIAAPKHQNAIEKETETEAKPAPKRAVIPEQNKSIIRDLSQMSFEEREEGFAVELEMSGYNPEDLNLEVTSDGIIVLTAKHENKSENGQSTKQFSRSFAVGKNIDLSRMKSTMSKKNILTITAPKRQEALKQNTTIPIFMDLQ